MPDQTTRADEPALAAGTGPADGPLATPPLATPPVSPLRAVAGASVAVAGVLLGVGALLWATDAPAGSPVVGALPPAVSVAGSAADPSPLASAAAEAPVPPAPGPVRASTRTPSASPGAGPGTAVHPAPVPLTVLNNSRRHGLAVTAARQFQAAGWPVRLVGSFRGRLTATTVYYDAGSRAAAFRLQAAFPGIERVHPRFRGLPGTGLTVVLIRTYDVGSS